MSEARDTISVRGAQRILIIDDDAVLLTGLKRALENQGYEVLTATNGERGLAALPVFQPNLIVLDVMMPGLDGWHVLERLRASGSNAQVPVVMLTADDSDASKIHGFELGADDYLTKPFSVRELRCRIAAVLRRTSTEQVDASATIPVVVRGSDVELLRVSDIYYAEGIRNYTYVHTSDARFLCRLTLGVLEQKHLDGLLRVHRSYIVNLRHVKGCGWAGKSSYKLRLTDAASTEIPVSRALIPEIQKQLGIKSD